MSFLRSIRPRTALVGMAFGALAAALPAAADEGARLRLAALVEEGDLLLEELATLEPVIERIRAESERSSVAERALKNESVALDREIAAYNAAAAELARAARQHHESCPRQSQDDQLIDACNARGADLMDFNARLEWEHAPLTARQQALNQRIDRHNAERDTRRAQKRELAPRIDTNEADANRWASSARGFMLTDEFAALAAQAENPGACAELRLSDAAAYQGTRGLKLLQACLEAVKDALP